MGGWKLEVFKMAVYMAFPVGLFHYFNQPQYFEEWVIKSNRELYPPDLYKNHKILTDFIKEQRMKEDLQLLNSLDNLSEKK